MKKSYFLTGLLYVAVGIVLLAAAAQVEGRLGSLLFGFGVACAASGLVMIFKYFYWSAPERRAAYQEKLEQETIELHDELRVKLSDKSGRYAYLIGLGVVAGSIVVFSLLDALNVLEGSRLVVLYLGGYLLFQIVIGQLVFRRLRGRYEGT